MDGGFKPVVALMAALALACVLISPMPDEVPGTAVKLGTLPFAVPADPRFDLWGAQQSMMATLPKAGLHPTFDVLGVTCARLC
jgi:hypothetical protein